MDRLHHRDGRSGGAILLAFFVALAAIRNGRLNLRTWLVLAGFVAFGGALCFGQILDLAHGPVVYRGKPAFEETETYGGRGGMHVAASLALSASDGNVKTIDTAGWQSTQEEDKLDGCSENDHPDGSGP